MVVYLNGKIVSKADAKVSVYDHGFLYGDGIFEGIRVYEGNIFRLKQHIDRLYESAQSLMLEIPMTHAEAMQATIDTVAASGLQDCYIRLVISRGVGDLGIDPANCPKPTVVIIVDTISLYPESMYQKGVPLVTSSVPRIPMKCFDPRIKSLNYLNNIMAKIEARRAGVPEALMLNVDGFVAECTADNVFVVKDGELRTPDLMQGALGGITRQTVLEIAAEKKMPIYEGVIGRHDLYNADECFLTGTAAEIVPVISLDGREIGSGKPGKLTHDLLAAYRELRVQDGAKVEYKTEAATS
jgi:branched-chain amino acid aminotransferase